MCRFREGVEATVKDQTNKRYIKYERYEFFDFQVALMGLMEGIVAELELQTFLAISPSQISLYEQKEPLFGPEVEARFPQMSEDISEAGKCLGLDRSTAAVFHLMRVMEAALQHFGSELGITLVAEKNWQNILDEVNSAIRKLDHKLSRTRSCLQSCQA